MELNKRTKTAIALIELLISLTMAAVLMLMLFGIVTKKARNGITHQDGVFYCWKDWDGTLYQKNSTDSIQRVSSCKIKIPKDAKNIQVFLIGGGAGGYKFNSLTINNILNSDSSYVGVSEEFVCLKPQSGSIFTRLQTNSGEKYNVMTSCETTCNSTCNCNIKPIYEKPSEIYAQLPTGSPFSRSFVKDLFVNAYCYIPVYEGGSVKYVKSSSDMVGENLYYYSGNAVNKPCIGICTISSEISECKVDSSEGTCYQDGRLMNTNHSYRPTLNYSSNYNKLNYKYLKAKINIGEFQESQTGDFKRGYAEAGKEYTITYDRIGSGGQAGASGGATYFGNLKANGGVLKKTANTEINISSEDVKISSLSELNKAKYISICSSSDINCNGAINEQLQELANDSRIKISSNVEILPSVYESNENWNDDKSIQKSANDIEKTGFGLFGSSAAAVDCAIKYYPVKELKYNDYNMASTNSNKSKITTCASGGNGMGGAIIIKWD